MGCIFSNAALNSSFSLSWSTVIGMSRSIGCGGLNLQSRFRPPAVRSVAPKSAFKVARLFWRYCPIADREATIKRLEAELLRKEEKPSGKPLPDLPSWVREQLRDLAGLLSLTPLG